MTIVGNTAGEARMEAHQSVVTVSTAAKVIDGDIRRRELLLQNKGTVPVYVWFGADGDGVSSSTGVELAKDVTLMTPYSGEVWATAASACSLRVVEFG